jgi:hypothetical protein
MLQVLVNTSLEKFCCRKETWGYAKEKGEKRKKGLKKMDTKMSGVLKTMGTKMPTMKKREKRDSPCSCKYFKFQQERYVSRSKVELG